MKKINLILILICSVFFSQKSMAHNESNSIGKGILIPASKSKKKGNDICKSGFFLNLGIFIPSKNYSFPTDFDNDSDEKFSLGYNFELGNLFRLVDMDDKAISLRATWFSASYTNFKYNGKVITNVIQASLIKLGPSFTVATSEDMAIDAFYQVAPTLIWDLDFDTRYLGATNSIGAALRFQIFTLGLDYNLGNITALDSFNDTNKYKIRTNHLRLFAGFKF